MRNLSHAGGIFGCWAPLSESWDARYAHKMTTYNELSWTDDNEIITYDDLFIVENLVPKKKVVGKKVEDGVKIKDEKHWTWWL